MAMYSPKIKEDLIPALYELKQARGYRFMTDLVNDILEREVTDSQAQEEIKDLYAGPINPFGIPVEVYDIETERSLLEQDEFVFNQVKG